MTNFTKLRDHLRKIAPADNSETTLRWKARANTLYRVEAQPLLDTLHRSAQWGLLRRRLLTDTQTNDAHPTVHRHVLLRTSRGANVAGFVSADVQIGESARTLPWQVSAILVQSDDALFIERGELPLPFPPASEQDERFADCVNRSLDHIESSVPHAFFRTVVQRTFDRAQPYKEAVSKSELDPGQEAEQAARSQADLDAFV